MGSFQKLLEELGDLLSRLSEELRLDVIQRLATLSSVSKSILRKIMNTMDSQIRELHSEPIMKVNGVEQAASILKLVPQSDSSTLLENLARQSGQLFDAIKRLMFTIDDLAAMDDRGLRNLMKQVDNQVLGKALKLASQDVRDAFFRNMSERAANMLQEDIESLPPMLLSDVEEAQGQIVEAASALIDEGKAVIAGLAGGEALV